MDGERDCVPVLDFYCVEGLFDQLCASMCTGTSGPHPLSPWMSLFLNIAQASASKQLGACSVIRVFFSTVEKAERRLLDAKRKAALVSECMSRSFPLTIGAD